MSTSYILFYHSVIINLSVFWEGVYEWKFYFPHLLLHVNNSCVARALQSEYDQLKQAHTDHVQRSSFNSDVIDDVISENNQNGGGDVEIIAEARLLRQHKGRLEARMRILEDHNEQLDSQLRHLRHLLNNSEEVWLFNYSVGLLKLIFIVI